MLEYTTTDWRICFESGFWVRTNRTKIKRGKFLVMRNFVAFCNSDSEHGEDGDLRVTCYPNPWSSDTFDKIVSEKIYLFIFFRLI